MSNALLVTWRTSCVGLRSPGVLSPASFRQQPHLLRMTPWNLSIVSVNRFCTSRHCKPSLGTLNPRAGFKSLNNESPINYIYNQRRTKRTTAAARSSAKSTSESSLGGKPRSEKQIRSIFASNTISAGLGNRTLAVLQARRIQGTLDLDLPTDISHSVPQTQLDTALEWLRQNYPLDEDAAILARIDREEIEAEQKLVRRAEELGLYKPQSGSYDAELGENKSVYGKSVLKEVREKNEKRLLAEKERKRQQWLEGEQQELEQLRRQVQGNTALQKYQEVGLTEARPRADPNERPYLAWVQKHHIAATELPIDSAELTTTQRLLSPFLFALATLGLCYYFAQNYEAPARRDRLWPDVPPAAATVGAIIGANIAVTLMWKYVPPAWKLLNRYFVIVPFYPRALAILGSTFSHQTWRHVATNMMVLGLMGTRVHDELGRGNFLAIYMASGAVGSLVSLSRSVLLGHLGMTSLGASAATSGVVAAWCMYHFDDKITMWILPRELRETFWTQGWIFLACLVATEVVSMVTPARFLRVWPLSRLTKMDHAAHLGGYLSGAGCGYALIQQRRARERQRARDSSWLDKLVR
ncbi:Rhomboid-like protein [Penicillium ucsense]|uniref:Rhomboid-like protein n=1 Tax=Penicillium ucsense TaxID=2839758 RepID=A0A8J8VZV9_9EURO|nr:Rhomboid-like protein [Penicillium ucsense]KAF7734586.1 Rhomboid-like protein [Penicillium ucsense]